MLEKISTFPFANLIRNKSVQNLIFLIIIQSSNVLISLISMPLLITSLGVDQFGMVNLALSIIILANIMVGFGYNLSAPREVAILQNDKEGLSHVFSKVISGRLSMALIAATLILVATLGFGIFQEYQMILLFSLLLLFSEATLPLWFFQGMEKMKLISISNIFSKLLFLMGIVLFIHSPEQAKWVNFMLGGSGLVINLLLLLYIHVVLKIYYYRPKFRNVLLTLKENIFLFLSNLASHVSNNGGLIILSFFAAAETLGMFSLAERISMVLRIFPSLVIQAVFPNASKLYQNDKTEFFRFLKKVYGITLFVGTGISLTIFVSAPFIIQLFGKSQMQESIGFLRILCFIPLMASLNIVNVVVFLVKDQKELMFRSSWFLLSYMLPVCFVLSFFFGGKGLCFGLLSSELAILVVCSVLNRKYNADLFQIHWQNKAKKSIH
jgi:O-antigen/teichoic acid export membrane protein